MRLIFGNTVGNLFNWLGDHENNSGKGFPRLRKENRNVILFKTLFEEAFSLNIYKWPMFRKKNAGVFWYLLMFYGHRFLKSNKIYEITFYCFLRRDKMEVLCFRIVIGESFEGHKLYGLETWPVKP